MLRCLALRAVPPILCLLFSLTNFSPDRRSSPQPHHPSLPSPCPRPYINQSSMGPSARSLSTCLCPASFLQLSSHSLLSRYPADCFNLPFATSPSLHPQEQHRSGMAFPDGARPEPLCQPIVDHFVITDSFPWIMLTNPTCCLHAPVLAPTGAARVQDGLPQRCPPRAPVLITSLLYHTFPPSSLPQLFSH